MRVPNISTYFNSTYRLGNLTRNLESANEKSSTQKRINEISDDPLGLSQVLTLNNTLGNLDQISRNVAMGKSWLQTSESALDSVNNLMLEVKTDITRLANDSTTADERRDSIQRIDNVIQQMIALGNTEANGNYIFGGTEVNQKPLEYDKTSGQVVYKGNNTPFEIRTDKSSGVAVGRSGQETFWDKEVHINSTNNTIVFQQDNGHGDASVKTLQAIIPEGLYTKAGLETAVRNAVNDVSSAQGYQVQYEVVYDTESGTYLIQDDGTHPGYVRTQFMWENGKNAYLSDIQGSASMKPEDIGVSILNQNTLTIGTTGSENPSGPLRVTWNQAENQWGVKNNPGYVMPSTFSGTATGVDIALNDTGIPDIRITFDSPVQDGDYVEFNIVPAREDTSTGHEMGFSGTNLILAPPVSDTRATDITSLTIGAGNNTLNFVETDSAGVQQLLTANFNTSGAPVTYTDMNALARAIESSMEAASAAGPNAIDYAVSFDPVSSRFSIGENGSQLNQLTLQWSTSTAAAATLGYFPMDDIIISPQTAAHSDQGVVNLVIDPTNNKIDFREVSPDGQGKVTGNLTAVIKSKTYTSHSELAREVEVALEAESRKKGNLIDYSVSWDDHTQKFTIKENGSRLSEFHLLWQTGDNAPIAQGGTGQSLGSILGFKSDQDDIKKPLQSSRTVEWGVFNTLIDLKTYLSTNDREGIERTIGRLENNFDNMTSRIVDTGMKFNRLEIRETLTANLHFNLTERRSTLEDADIVQTILDLKNIETAYQAALSSTAKVLGLSLVDYLR